MERSLLDTPCQDVQHAESPLPWWMEVHHKAREAHRSIDMQLMLATGDDLEAMKEKKRKCSS